MNLSCIKSVCRRMNLRRLLKKVYAPLSCLGCPLRDWWWLDEQQWAKNAPYTRDTPKTTERRANTSRKAVVYLWRRWCEHKHRLRGRWFCCCSRHHVWSLPTTTDFQNQCHSYAVALKTFDEREREKEKKKMEKENAQLIDPRSNGIDPPPEKVLNNTRLSSSWDC